MVVATNESSDDELLTAWRSGDKRAGMALFGRHHASIAGFFMKKIGSGPECDDLVQSTFLGLLEGIDRFRSEASFRTLLFAIARNKLYGHLRDLMRDRRRFDPAEVPITAIQLTPTQVFAQRDQDKLLLAALRTLPLDTQLMLELHYWEQLSIKEISSVLDLPEGTVKTRMHRGRKQLGAKMAELAESQQELELSLSRISQWAERLQRELEK